jgi:predicted nucleic acid-binding protein
MMPALYVDTSLLVSLYLTDANTPAALAVVAKSARPLMLTAWQRFEMENALQLRRFRRESTQADLNEARDRLLDDLEAGAVIEVPLGLSAVLQLAGQLSAKHSAQLGTRAFDVFHVAAACHLKASGFLSFDTRQVSLARAAGLRVLT